MKPEKYSANRLANLFRVKKIATMAELKEALGTDVDMTVFRKLQELDYRTSYSHRGRYYTLAKIAEFDVGEHNGKVLKTTAKVERHAAMWRAFFSAVRFSFTAQLYA